MVKNLDGTFSIRRFFIVLSIAVAIILSVFLVGLANNIFYLYDNTQYLLSYSYKWNDILSSMLTVSENLDYLQNSSMDSYSAYLDSAKSLSDSIKSFLSDFDVDSDTYNVFRRLQTFNSYQQDLISNSVSPADIYQGRVYIEHGFELHTDDILNSYRKQMDSELEKYTEQEYLIIKSTVLGFFVTMFFLLIIYLIHIIFAMKLRKMVNVAITNLDRIARREWFVPDLEKSYFYEFMKLFSGINRLKGMLSDYFTQLKRSADIEKKLMVEKLKNETASRMLINAEMEMLRSQVNPHFLFNALSQIGMTALISEPAKVLEMVEYTGKILRYSLYNKEMLVKLRDEISIVETYMKLYQMGNPSNISFSIANEYGEFDDIFIIPMCIQPLVENCLKHAMVGKTGTLDISIDIKSKDGLLYIIIKDNGIGIADIENTIKCTKNRIGLENIKRRLELQYGISDLLSVRSVYGEYTEVEVRFPLEMENSVGNVE